MVKYLNLPSFLLTSFLIRLLITGASLGDAIVIIALTALLGGYIYILDRKEPEVNKELKNRLSDLETQYLVTKEKLNAIHLVQGIKRTT